MRKRGLKIRRERRVRGVFERETVFWSRGFLREEEGGEGGKREV